jgi:3-deoxy-D-manno-octulosonic acid kinase
VDADFAAAAESLALLDPAVLTALFAAASGARGRTRTAVVALPGGERLQLRPVHHGGLLGSLWGDWLLGPGRPLRELRVNATLRARGAPVPRPVLVVARRRGPLWSAVVGTLHEPDTCDGAALLASAPTPARLGAAIEAAARAVRRFHDAGGWHADLHVGNLLFREQEGCREALVIDLDKARAGAPPDARRRLHELMRLYRSVVKRGADAEVGARGCARFLRAYCAGDRTLRRAMLEDLPGERRRLARHVRGWRRGANEVRE